MNELERKPTKGYWRVWDWDITDEEYREDYEDQLADPLGVWFGYADEVAFSVDVGDRTVVTLEWLDVPPQGVVVNFPKKEVEGQGLNVVFSGVNIFDEDRKMIDRFFDRRPVSAHYSSWANCAYITDDDSDEGKVRKKELEILKMALAKLDSEEIKMLKQCGFSMESLV